MDVVGLLEGRKGRKGRNVAVGRIHRQTGKIEELRDSAREDVRQGFDMGRGNPSAGPVPLCREEDPRVYGVGR